MMNKYDFSDLQFLRTKHLLVLVDCKNSAVFHVYSIRSARMRELSNKQLWNECSSEINSVRIVDEKKANRLLNSGAICPNGEFHLYTSHHAIQTSNVHIYVDELIYTLREYANHLKINLFFDEVQVTYYNPTNGCLAEDKHLTENELEYVIPGISTDHHGRIYN